VSVLEEVAKLVGENAALALHEQRLLRQTPPPSPRSSRDHIRYKVVVRASPDAEYKHRDGWRLIKEFQCVLHCMDPHWGGYLRDRATKAEKIWTVKGAAYKQYLLACSLGLLAWFVPVHMVPDHNLTETNA